MKVTRTARTLSWPEGQRAVPRAGHLGAGATLLASFVRQQLSAQTGFRLGTSALRAEDYKLLWPTTDALPHAAPNTESW